MTLGRAFKIIRSYSNLRIILLTLISLLILFNVHPVSGQMLQVDAWTNKGGQGTNNLNGGTYHLGEVVTIYCSVSSAVDRLVVTIYKPDGSVLTLYDGAWPGGYSKNLESLDTRWVKGG